MASVESPRNHLLKPQRVGDIEPRSNKPKPRPDGDDFCAICDNGGDLTCCEGGCQRSFHLSDQNNNKISKGLECRLILGLAEEQAKMIIAGDKDFICKNCKYKQHQCFACGKLGSSDLTSKAEVFQCEVDDCGHFYHPKCVAELLYPESELDVTLFEVQVAAREKFTCPRHECIKCRGGEDMNDPNMQFAVCRRCPTTFHRKCLPRDIPFETKEGPNGYKQKQRAWDKWVGPDGRTILHDRILIYCTKHDIMDKLETPKRNHIIFPDAKKLRVPKILVGSTTEDDIHVEEELLDDTSPEPPESPPATNDQDQCSCSSPINSFAPESLFRNPHPGTCGWLGG